MKALKYISVILIALLFIAGGGYYSYLITAPKAPEPFVETIDNEAIENLKEMRQTLEARNESYEELVEIAKSEAESSLKKTRYGGRYTIMGKTYTVYGTAGSSRGSSSGGGYSSGGGSSSSGGGNYEINVSGDVEVWGYCHDCGISYNTEYCPQCGH